MMKLDDRIIRLIAVGASITANCQPCLEINIAKALENGADDQEISEAIEVGKKSGLVQPPKWTSLPRILTPPFLLPSLDGTANVAVVLL